MAVEFDLCRAFVDAHPDDAARALERLPPAHACALIEALPAAPAARAFGMMTPSAAADCLARLAPQTAGAILVGLRTDLAAVLVRQVDASVRTAILERLPSDEAGVLLANLRHPEGTAGALMDPRVVAVPEDLRAGDALVVLRRSPRHLHEYLYVVDRGQKLVGLVGLDALLHARPADLLATIMTRSVGRLPAHAGPAAILAHTGWREFHALPVVDEQSVLIGAISYTTLRALEAGAHSRLPRLDAVATAFALGELYWVGLSGMLDALASAVGRARSRSNASGEGAHGPL